MGLRSVGIAVLLVATAPPAWGRPRRAGILKNSGKPAIRAHEDPPPRLEDPSATATRIASLDSASCLDRLSRRGVHYRSAGPAPGVETPVRLVGPLDGVAYRTDYPDKRRDSVPFEVFDCRLVLALLELNPILKAHSVDEVRIYSAWRPPIKSWPAGKPGRAHPGGLAVDLRLFKKSNGEELEVESDFLGTLGKDPCTSDGSSADRPSDAPPAARELREIYCGAADAKLFHVQLSPNYDGRHHNHFHLEVRPGVRWFIVR